MRTFFVLFSFTLMLVAANAHAQRQPKCVMLNDPTLSGQYLSVTNKLELEGTGAYTLEAWVNPSSFAGFPTIIGNDFRTGYWLGLTTTGRVRFYPRAGLSVDSPGSISLNTWTHVATTYSPTNGYEIYVDGVRVLAGTSITGPQTSSTGDLRIGADRLSATTPSYFWRGKLDEVRIWQGVARTGEQIRETMFQGVPGYPGSWPEYSALKGNWSVALVITSSLPHYVRDQAHTYTGTWILNDAYLVNGTAETLVVPDGAPLAYNVGTQFTGLNYAVGNEHVEFSQGLTISAWVCPYDITNFQTIAGRVWTQSFWLGLTPGGGIRFYPRGGGLFFDTPAGLEVNTWHHISATYRDGSAKIYVDGALVNTHTAIAGPVFDNGRNVWVGADSTGAGPSYGFRGILDNVLVAGCELPPEVIRRDMGWGYESLVYAPAHINTPSSPCAAGGANTFGLEEGLVYGAGAKLVRSGAPLQAQEFGTRDFLYTIPGSPLWPSVAYRVHTPTSIYAPEHYQLQSVSSDLVADMPVAMTDIRVMVNLASNNLPSVELELRSPAGTAVTLIRRGEGRGRDVTTDFRDNASPTLATGPSGYPAGVRPSEPLAALLGESAHGVWHLDAISDTGRVCLFDWGIRVWGTSLLDAPAASMSPKTLRLVGGPVVRDQGRLSFAITRHEHARVELMDLQGRLVRTLFESREGIGEYQVSFRASDLTPGIYMARLRVGGDTAGTVRVAVIH